MSLYHETAQVLSAPASAGGNLKTRIFGKKDLKAPRQQIYALALETCKWSPILKEVIEKADILRLERKLTPLLALLLVHDFLLAKGGIALPVSHGLRACIERHKARLNAEFTKARLRRKAASVDVLRQQVTAAFASVASPFPRWVRVNTLQTTLEDQLDTTFKNLTRVDTIKDVTSSPDGNALYVDEHIPNLVAVSPSFEVVKSEAYKSGKVILQDKASCFPAYLLDPCPEDGDVIDSCSAPGNKTTHLAAIVSSRMAESGAGHSSRPTVYAFEKDRQRSKTLDKMVTLAGAKEVTRISPGQDFLQIDPQAPLYQNVGALLLDPSCSGSGIVGRDVMPPIHLPEMPGTKASATGKDRGRKRKREKDVDEEQVLIDDDGQETVVSSEKELAARLEALASFQLTLLLHAFKFSSAKKITYSTCSIHAQENEQVVLQALQSDVARKRNWRILARDRQVRGIKEWPVRGTVEAAGGDRAVAEACVRSYNDDGRGVMGFFVAAFVRDGGEPDADGDPGPHMRDKNGRDVARPMQNPRRAGRADEDQRAQPEGMDTAKMSHQHDAEEDAVSGHESASEGDEWSGFGD